MNPKFISLQHPQDDLAMIEAICEAEGAEFYLVK